MEEIISGKDRFLLEVKKRGSYGWWWEKMQQRDLKRSETTKTGGEREKSRGGMKNRSASESLTVKTAMVLLPCQRAVQFPTNLLPLVGFHAPAKIIVTRNLVLSITKQLAVGLIKPTMCRRQNSLLKAYQGVAVCCLQFHATPPTFLIRNNLWDLVYQSPTRTYGAWLW